MRVLCLCWNLSHTHEFDVILRKLRSYFGETASIHLFVFQAERPDMRAYFNERGVALHAAGLSSDAGGSRAARLLRLMTRTVPALLCAARRSEVVFSFGNAAFSGFLGLVIARMARRPVIVRVNGAGVRMRKELKGLRRRIMTGAERKALSRANAVVFLSQAQRTAELASHGLVRDNRHVVVSPGVAEERFSRAPEGEIVRRRQELDLRAEDRLTGTIADARPVKNIEASLRAVAEVRGRGLPVHFALIGPINDKDYRNVLVDLAESLGITQAFHLVGPVPNVELAPWYSTLDVTMLTSHMEGFGLSITESGLCGTPAIASNRGGMVEQIEDGVTGYLIDPDDADELADTLAIALRDPSQLTAMGQAARTYVSERFTERAANEQFAGALRLCGLAVEPAERLS